MAKPRPGFSICIQAALALAWATWMVHGRRRTALAPWLGQPADAMCPADPSGDEPDAENLCRPVASLGRRLRCSCLVQALAGARLLRRRGLAARVVVGVRRDHGDFRAHAWLMCGSKTILGGAGAEGYRELASFE